MKCLYIVVIAIVLPFCSSSQLASLAGNIMAGDDPAAFATITLQPTGINKVSTEYGFFRYPKLKSGRYELTVSYLGFKLHREAVIIDKRNIILNIKLQRDSVSLEGITITGSKAEAVSGRLKDVDGTDIYAGKKTESITMRNLNANLANNNTRQVYARIPGLNIWEYDRGGLQLGIGGRGLSPNRSANFNIRQNGYDISADALGYPESYYTPSTEALEKINITRGAASLQYGPQFGGLINFVMKEGPKDKKFELTSRQTGGSYGFFNSFNSIGGTIANGKLNYYGFYQFKRGDDWRPNSHYDQHNAYIHLSYQLTEKFRITTEYTLMKYLAQQPGGLTDEQFKADPSVSVRSRNWFQVDWNLISVNLDYQLGGNTRLNMRNYTLQGGRQALGILSYINRPDNGGNRDVLDDRYNNFGSELRFIHEYSIGDRTANTFLVGTRIYQGLTKRKQGDGSANADADFNFFGTEPNKSNFRFPGTNIALFAENIFRLNKRWSVTPGIRVEHINTKADGYYYKQNIFIASEKIYETKSNPRSFALLGIGTSWKFDNGTEIYGNISQNYRSINFNDIRVINVNSRVDPGLRDETGYNVDLGYRGTIGGWLYADLSLFYLKYNDRIGSIFTRDADLMTYRLRTNIADSRNLGLEFLLEGDILRALTKGQSFHKLNLYTNISVIDARYVHTRNTAISNKLVESVPPIVFRTGASFGTNRYNITLQFSHQGKQYSDATNTEITPTAVDGVIPAYSVVDLSLSYNWRSITVYTGVNNLTDTRYYSRRADGYPGPGILPADKRNFYLTLQFKLHGN